MASVIREGKGSSLVKFPNLGEIVVVDLETTGLSAQWDHIIEIAALKIREDGVNESFCSLVKDGEVEIDGFITSLTGITQEMIDEAPDIKGVLEKFKEFVGNAIILGHNVNFDINFLWEAYEKWFAVPFENDFVDTLRVSRKLHPEERHHRLWELMERYGIPEEGAHRALIDCEHTLKVFDALKKDAIQQYGSVEAFESTIEANIRKKSHRGLDISTILAQGEPDPESPLYEKSVCITGALEKMIRKDALQLVANIGGVPTDSVTKKTDFLVIGNNDYCKTIKDGKSSKQKKAEQLQLKGQDITILSENDFYELILQQ